jgi:hypothetical protein
MEFDLNGIGYKAEKLDAMKQFHIARKLAPVLSELAPGQNQESQISGLASAISKIGDKEAEFVIYSLLSCVKRKMGHGLGYSKVANESSLMYDDIDLKAMMHLVWQSLQFNFSDFFGALPLDLLSANQKQNGQ